MYILYRSRSKTQNKTREQTNVRGTEEERGCMEYAQHNIYACMKTLLNNKEIKNIEIFNINKDSYESKNKNKTDTPHKSLTAAP